MRPAEFWTATPGEVWAMVAAYHAREKAELRRQALLAQMVRATVWADGQCPTIDDLLGWPAADVVTSGDADPIGDAAFESIWNSLARGQDTVGQ